MPRTFVTTLLVLAALTCCRNNDLNLQSHRSIIIVDSLIATEPFRLQKNKAPIAAHLLYYVGELRDTIRLPREPLSAEWSDLEASQAVRDFVFCDSNRISIYVDTTTVFAAQSFVDGQPQDSIGVKSYGIFVRNLTNATVYLSAFNSLFTIQQIQASDGRWVDVEIPAMHFCGVGARKNDLRANDIAIAKFTCRDAKIKVKSRLAIKQWEVYSNVFYDLVDSIPKHSIRQEKVWEWIDRQKDSLF